MFKRAKNKVSQIGSVVALPEMLIKPKGLVPFTWSYTNSSGSSKTVIFGDPCYLVTQQLKESGVVTAEWFGVADLVGQAQNRSLQNTPVIVGETNIEVSSSTLFGLKYQLYQTDVAGNGITKTIALQAARRNNSFNADLLTIKMDYILNSLTALAVSDVPDGATITLTFTPKAFFAL